MKLRINKACDLSSISVFPPRRTGGLISSQGTSQLRSQSQQSFSQGASLSQLSQFDENLISDQRLGSNDNSLRAAPPFPSASSCIRDEPQMQLARVAPSTVPRWSSSSARDAKSGQVSEEIDQRLQHVETMLSKMDERLRHLETKIIDSVQSDIMRINDSVKDVLRQTGGIQQKIITMDDSLQQILKGQENAKAFFDESLKNICELTKNSNSTKLNEVSSQISAIPDQILANFSKLHNEIIRLFARETEIIVSNFKSLSSRHGNSIQAPISRTCDDSMPLVKEFVSVTKHLAQNPIGPISRPLAVKVEEDKAKLLQPKLICAHQNSQPRMEDSSARQKQINFVNLDSDEEKDRSDSGSLVLLKKESSDNESCWMKEAMKDSLRILREARKRKRRQMRNTSRHDT